MKKTALVIVLLANIAVIAGFWGWNAIHHPLGNLLTIDTASRLVSFGRAAGLLAAFCVLLQLILIGRVKWVESAFGLDHLIRLHRLNALLILVLLSLHSSLIIFGSAQENFVSIAAQLLDFFNNWEDIPAAIVGAVLIVLVIIVSIGPIRGRLKYSWWYRFHLLTYLALALAFGHQIEVGSDFTDNQYFRWYWYAIYAFVLLNLIVYRVVKPLYYYMQQHFSVERIVNETGDVVSVYIRGRNLSRFRVAAGQFMILHFLGKGFRWEAHPFSLSCPPNSEYLRLSIKRVGDFTARLGDLQPGTPVLIDGPHGIFTPKRCSSRNVLLIAGGIGITPLRSMLDTFVSQGKDVILLYGNRHRSDIVFEKELDQFVQKGRLVVRHILSNDPDWEGEKGHINRERIQRLVPDVAERDVFLCGPPPMMSAVVKALTELGVPTGKVHYERFAL